MASLVTDPLQAVIQVRQVDEIESGRVAFVGPLGGLGDPAATLDAGQRTPEVEQGEAAKRILQCGPQVGRLGVDVGDRAAVGPVDGTLGNGVVGARVGVVAPEEVGAGEVGIVLGHVYERLTRSR
jgi:hypothetical protein